MRVYILGENSLKVYYKYLYSLIFFNVFDIRKNFFLDILIVMGCYILLFLVSRNLLSFLFGFRRWMR